MTAQELAALLTGREYLEEIGEEEEAMAKAEGLVVVFGASDDLMEFRGAIHDEIGAYEGTTARVTATGLLEDWETFLNSHEPESAFEAYFEKKRSGFKEIEACWCAEDGYSWTFKSEIPHATFEIVEDGEPYCRGIVFRLEDAKP